MENLMEICNIFKVSVIMIVFVFVGCGGDININEGDEVVIILIILIIFIILIILIIFDVDMLFFLGFVIDVLSEFLGMIIDKFVYCLDIDLIII